MGCCSKKKSTKSKKTLKGAPKKGGKTSDKSKKGGKKPLAGAKGGKKGGPASKSNSSKRTPAKGKSPGVRGAVAATSAPPLQRLPADKRPVKTPSTVSSTKSAKSGQSSGSSKKGGATSASSAPRSPNPADARQAKKRENHAKSLNKAAVKAQANAQSEPRTARSPPLDAKKVSKEKTVPAPKIPAVPPPREKKGAEADQSGKSSKSARQKRQDQVDKSSSHSSAARNSPRAPRPRAVSRSKLPMQKLTISSHVEDGIVVSQWYYTELRELGTQPSSVADLLQGGPRQQLNLPQPQ